MTNISLSLYIYIYTYTHTHIYIHVCDKVWSFIIIIHHHLSSFIITYHHFSRCFKRSHSDLQLTASSEVTFREGPLTRPPKRRLSPSLTSSDIKQYRNCHETMQIHWVTLRLISNVTFFYSFFFFCEGVVKTRQQK